jgi:hypothetical protein
MFYPYVIPRFQGERSCGAEIHFPSAFEPEQMMEENIERAGSIAGAIPCYSGCALPLLIYP